MGGDRYAQTLVIFATLLQSRPHPTYPQLLYRKYQSEIQLLQIFCIHTVITFSQTEFLHGWQKAPKLPFSQSVATPHSDQRLQLHIYGSRQTLSGFRTKYI